MTEGAGPTQVAVVLHATDQQIQGLAQVIVVDNGLGTATTGADYTTFGPQAVSFPPGSVDGAVQVVVFEPLDDLLVESANETVKLGLQSPIGGRVTGPISHTIEVIDANRASIGFATNSSVAADENTASHPVALELDLGPGVRLGAPVSVQVSDLHSGTASSLSDYSFTEGAVSFPLGSRDGAVRTVDVQVIDDPAFENDETVVLGLSQPSASCDLGLIVLHVLTIPNDDVDNSPDLAVSAGATGTENPLAYDEQVSLGTQNVGAGPNAGTLVRVTNAGGGTLHLGAPSLAGNHPNDFAVDVESASAPALGLTSGLAPAEAPVPLVARAAMGGPGLGLCVDAAGLARMAAHERVTLFDFPLPDLGPVTLELERRPLPLAAAAKLAIDGREVAGGVRTLVGELQLWRGVVAGMPGSRVFLALSGSGAHGFLELPLVPERFVHVMGDGKGGARVVREGELARLGLVPQDVCSGAREVPGQPLVQELVGPEPPQSSALTVADCTLAIETDFQFYDKFDSSVLLTNYVTSLIGAVSDQYYTDVQTTLSIAYLGIHTNSNDGWTTQETGGADVGDLLDEFRDAWTDPAPNTRPAGALGTDIAHFLSGAVLGGGVAYVNVLCNQSFAFGASANLNGNINWPTWTGEPGGFTWDFVITAHELGHNFGALHTHDYCPPLDHCYSNCDGTTSCPRGTLMSYCHTCAGLANMDLYFHPVNANVMRQRVNTSCLDDAALLPGDFVQYRVRFNPLTNTGARSATLEFAHDASNITQPFRVRLFGTAN